MTFLGCGSGLDGVWLFSLQVDPQAAEECIDSVSHNFADASRPAEEDGLGEDPWTSETLTEFSDEVFFGLITSTSEGAVLVVGDETYTGLQDDDGVWTFDWTHSQQLDDSDQHGSGYGWTSNIHVQETTAFTLSVTGDAGTGQLIGSSSVDAVYNESDAWSEDLVDSLGETGRIPASSYLVKDAGDGGSRPATNDWALADCSSNPCTLGVTTSCSLRASLDSERTDLDPAAFDGVERAGQDAGL